MYLMIKTKINQHFCYILTHAVKKNIFIILAREVVFKLIITHLIVLYCIISCIFNLIRKG